MWEMLHPVESLAGDAMRAVGDAETTFWHDLQPEYEAMHANSGALPNECIFITMHEFLSDQWGGCHVVPSYQTRTCAAPTTAPPTASTAACSRRSSSARAAGSGCSRRRAISPSCARSSRSTPRRASSTRTATR